MSEVQIAVNSTRVYKEGTLLKAPRNRSPLALFIPGNWTSRTVKLHVDKTIQYWAEGELKGEVNFNGGAKFGDLSVHDGHSFCYEVSNKVGDSILFSADSAEEAEAWKTAILSVVNETFERDLRLEQLSNLIQVDKLELVLDEKECKESLVASGYTVDRFVEIFYITYLDNLISGIKNYVDKDPILFVRSFKESLHGSRRIIFRSKTEEDSSNGYYCCSFNPMGDFIVAYTKNAIWTNIQYMCADIENVISVDGVPYVVAQGCQQYQQQLNVSLARLEKALGCSKVRLVADFHSLRVMFEKGNYAISRYGEIIYDVYMSTLVDRIERELGGDEAKTSLFRDKFFGLTVMILYTPQDEMSGYHQCSFIDGVFVLKIKNFYTNMSELGSDIGELLEA